MKHLTVEQKIINEAMTLGLPLEVQYQDKEVLCLVVARGSDSVKLVIDKDSFTSIIEVFPIDDHNDIKQIKVESLESALSCMQTFNSYRELIVKPTFLNL